MVSVPLIHAQFVPPKIKNHIRRTCLLDLGFSVLSHRVTTVVAPAGFGKSVWISSLLNEPGWPSTTWLSLDSHDSEPSFLLYHLIYALRFIKPTFGDKSLRTMNSLHDIRRDWQIAASSLLDEISQDNENEIVLVLDDFHLIDKSNIVCNILEYLIRWLPAKIHLIIISRAALPLKLFKEQFSGELLEIKSEQLLFSIEEIREFLLILSLKPDENTIKAIHHFTEGWAVSLRLVGIHLQQSGSDLDKIISALKQKDAVIYTYLSMELLDNLSSELQNFLLDSSLLPYLEPELCNAALQCGDSAAKIKQLSSLGILSLIKDEITVWRLHHLMGEFLVQKVMQLRQPDYILMLRRRAAAYFERQEDIDRALEQVFAISDWPTAVNLITAHGSEYLESGRLDTLYSWICRLPDNYVASDHRLLYLKGNCLVHADSEEALTLLSKSVDLAEKSRDVKGQLRSLITMLPIYTFTNNIKKLQETSDRIPIAASLLKDPWTRGVILVAGLARTVTEDNLKFGVWLSRLAGNCKLDPMWRMYYLFSSGIIQYRLGNLSRAKQFVEEALDLPIVRDSDRWTGTAFEILSGIYCDMGNYKKTSELSRELLRLGQKYHVPHQLAYAYRRQAKMHQRDDDLVKARREYELSYEAWLNANNNLMAHITHLEIILVRSLSGEDPKSLLMEIEEPLSFLSTATGQGYQDYAFSLAGVIAREAGEMTLAEKWLEESSASSAEKGAKQLLAGTLLHLAKLYMIKDEEHKADRCLRQALNIADTAELDVFWDWHKETVYDLCQRALLKQIHPKWAVHILLRWFSQRIRKEAGNLLVYPDENVRKAISGLLQTVTRETGVPVIHLNCLGSFRIFVNGIEILPSQWKTKKAENLTKYLIINKGQHLKEKIIEELWPESDPKLGDASLRMALTHVRQALELSDSTRESILLKRGKIYFNPEIEIFTDYELFTSLAQKALAAPPSNNPDEIVLLEQAVNLYPGGFLPDNPYDDWTINIRDQLQSLYLQVLLRQIDYYCRQNKLLPAIHACSLFLAIEPYNEEICRKAMDLLWQDGQKLQALSLYQKLAHILTTDYNLDPSKETSSLYEKIRCS